MERKKFKIKVKYPPNLYIYSQDIVTLHRMEENLEEKDPDIQQLLKDKNTNFAVVILEDFNDKFEINGIEYNKKDIPYFKLYSPKLKVNIFVSAEELEQIVNKSVIEKGIIKTPLYPIPKLDKYGKPIEEYDFLTKKEFYAFIRKLEEQNKTENQIKKIINQNKKKFSNIVKNDKTTKEVKTPQIFDIYVSNNGDILLYLDKHSEKEHLTINLNNFIFKNGYKYENIEKVLKKFSEKINEISDVSKEKYYPYSHINRTKQNLVILFEELLDGMLKKDFYFQEVKETESFLETDKIRKISKEFQNSLKLYKEPIKKFNIEKPFFFLTDDIKNNIDKILKNVKNKEELIGNNFDLDDYIDHDLIHKNFAEKQENENELKKQQKMEPSN